MRIIEQIYDQLTNEFVFQSVGWQTCFYVIFTAHGRAVENKIAEKQ